MASQAESLLAPSAVSTAAASSSSSSSSSDGRSSPHQSSPLSRQSSLCSLTLDEFQQSVHDSGKSLGSMNMDEFLLSIWTAEEAHQAAAAASQPNPNGETTEITQHSLGRQGSALSLLPEIDGGEGKELQLGNSANERNTSSSQPLLQGGMTLEDFLMKAGVVSEDCGPSSPSQRRHYGENFRNKSGMAAGQNQNSGVDSGMLALGLALSPASSDGCVPSRDVDDSVGQQEVEMGVGVMRRRKRMLVDFGGPFDEGAERRQRRMIKNRESAARSRARRQAYTMELEAELRQLKEENALLKKETAELVDDLKKKLLEPSKEVATNGPSTAGINGKRLRRTLSWP